jgi:ComF family protein
MSKFSSFFLDLIFPPACLSCSRFNHWLCPTCQGKIKLNKGSICPYCLEETHNFQKHQKCRGNIDGLISLWQYKGVVQIWIKQIKYQYYFSYTKSLVDLYLVYLSLLKPQSFYDFLNTKPLIIPIPLHKSKFKTRGFNQSFLIAKNLANNWNLPISNKIIFRSKNTPPQASLTKAKRKKNMKNAFILNLSLKKLGIKPLKNQNVLLIDDVFTTGSTCQEAARILKTVGVNKVWVLTLAR